MLVIPRDKICPVLHLAEIKLDRDQKARAELYKHYGLEPDDTLDKYGDLAKY